MMHGGTVLYRLRKGEDTRMSSHEELKFGHDHAEPLLLFTFDLFSPGPYLSKRFVEEQSGNRTYL